MKYLLVTLWLAVCVCSALAQEFKPYPRERVTAEQWQDYFDQVRAKYSPATGIPDDVKLTIFMPEGALYAFTQPGHPAHPAWITREIFTDSEGFVRLRMIGYFAGSEEEFANLWRQYEELNRQMEEYIKSQNRAKQPDKPSN
jgi:hypothetical protein